MNRFKQVGIVLCVTLLACFSTAQEEDETPEMVVASTLKLNTTNIDPQAQKAYNDAIQAMEALHYERAFTFFTNAIDIAPEFTIAYVNRGHVLVGLERWEEAEQDFLKAVTLDDQLDAVYIELAGIVAQKDSLNLALSYVQKAYAIDPSNANYSYQIGVYSFLTEDFETAIEKFSTAIKQDSKLAKAYNDRGSAYKEIGEHEKAKADFEKAFRLDPLLVVALTNLGALHKEQENYSEAIRYYSEALAVDRHNEWIRNNRALTYKAQGDFEAAQRDLLAIVEMNPNHAVAYNNLAGIAIKQQEYKKAVEYATKAIAIDHNFGQAYCNRGIANEMLREEVAACEDWDAALDLGIDLAERYFQRINCSTLISQD